MDKYLITNELNYSNMKKLLKLTGYVLWIFGIFGILSLLFALISKPRIYPILGGGFLISLLMIAIAYFLVEKYGDEKLL